MTYQDAKENLLRAVSNRSDVRAAVAKAEQALAQAKQWLSDAALAVLEAEAIERRATDERIEQ